MAEERTGFLARWARRKNEVLQGKPPAEPAAVEKTEVAASPALLKNTAPAASLPAANPAEQPAKVLSLDDVKLLTAESDFTPFMARDVGPDVRNAAMKKLFTDPHYNIMDGLDIYIDDYTKSDPIPESMLRQMVGAKLLKIFDDEDDDEKTGNEGNAAQLPTKALPPGRLDNPAPQTMAEAGHSPAAEIPESVGNEPSNPPEPANGAGFDDPAASAPGAASGAS
jgi:Protein of unknown function (DUF3306)